MLYRDTDISRQLAGERHAELKQDRRTTGDAASTPVESRSTRHARLAWLRTQLRSAGGTPARHAS
ncbi:MAG TPA: hypothetical protein VFP09_07050 [Desertimonas sp.]|nr:hypothetical protein [Desertimonas sp.]